MAEIPDEAVRLAGLAIRELNAGTPEDFARAALEAAAPVLADSRAEGLRAALSSITSCITTSASDFGPYWRDSWVYGIAVGWDCEEDHDHDDICGSTAAMTELAARHGWDEAAVARLRSHRKAYAEASSPPTGTASD